MISMVDLKKQYTADDFSTVLNDMGPLSYWEAGGFWLLNDYDTAKSLLLDKRMSADRTPFFIRRMPDINPQVIKTFLGVVQNMMVMSDGKDHQNRRRICFHAFKPFMQQMLIPRIRSKLDELVGDKQSLDLVKDIAEPISMYMLSLMFAIPPEDQVEFFKHAKTMTLFFGGATAFNNETGAEVNHSASVLLDYFIKLFCQARHNASSPFVDTLMHFQSHYGLSMESLAAQAIMMFVAGQVTTADQICHDAYQLMQPAIWDELKSHPQDLPLYVREATRLDPAVTFLFRVASEDIVVHDQLIEKGEAIFIANHVVNRSEHVFGNGHVFNPHRPQQTIFSYGFGSHYCLGEKLGTLQIETVMDYFLSLEKPFTLQHDQCERLHYSTAFSGFQKMPMVRQSS